MTTIFKGLSIGALAVGGLIASLAVADTPAVKTLYIVNIIPGDAKNYTVSKEISDIEKSTLLAIQEFTSQHPSCKFKQELTVKSGSESDLYEKVKSISKEPGKKAAVGFSRSSLARLAAKAAQDSEVVGISIGAAADDLRTYDPNFITMASPWREQWKALLSEMKKSSCSPTNTLVIGDVRDSYSFNFRNAATEFGFRKTFDFDSNEVTSGFEGLASDAKCIFLAMNISTSHQLLSKLFSKRWRGTVFGTGDWHYYSGDLKELLRGSKRSNAMRIVVPTGWNANESPTSRAFSSRLGEILGHPPGPNGAYSYDAIQLALGYLCLDINPLVYSHTQLMRLHLVRSYKGISPGGNYLSPIHVVTYDGR